MRRNSEESAQRKRLAEVLGMAACPAPSPGLFRSIVDAAPAAPERPAWRQPRFAMALAAAMLVALATFSFWPGSGEPDSLAEGDEIAAVDLLAL